jgi:hypothetical protein
VIRLYFALYALLNLTMKLSVFDIQDQATARLMPDVINVRASSALLSRSQSGKSGICYHLRTPKQYFLDALPT